MVMILIRWRLFLPPKWRNASVLNEQGNHGSKFDTRAHHAQYCCHPAASMHCLPFRLMALAELSNCTPVRKLRRDLHHCRLQDQHHHAVVSTNQ
ncbi:uncharacterized protein K441DRAFT_106628 [Cenococcum geophilum 1.58]|uniref:uncharacterized protein n=1 Tax=Cenococcum geophilum 1.58 TaxID=794803 RepID=UPI00358F1C38|nr:hypothetical protein K441DRAFT_106628 [Cenococcum geophilum 1.58]